MSSRFFALIGDPAQIAARRETFVLPHKMIAHEAAPNIMVAVEPGLKVRLLGRDRGAILGTLFHRYGSPSEVGPLSDVDNDGIVGTSGQLLVDRYWGRYLALIVSSDRQFALRDPGGMFPCHVAADAGILMLASDPMLLAEIGFINPEIDNEGLARAIAFGGLPEERTALHGVRRLLPGMRLESLGGQVSTSFTWSPWDFVGCGANVEMVDAVEKLRRVTQMTVSAWSHTFDRGLIGISGGLDSSIVAATLRRAGNILSGLTLVTNDPLGDERDFASAVASHIGMPLYEDAYSILDIDLDRSSVAHLAVPFGRVDALAYDAALLRASRDTQSKAIFSGNGGDNIFYMSRSARALADRLISQGCVSGLFETAGNIAKSTGSSVVKVAQGAFSNWRMRAQGYTWQIDETFMSKGAVSSHGWDLHPWLNPPSGHILPGKAAHVAMMLRVQQSLDAYSERGGLPVIHPLISQPIVEYCLSIPTWFQFDGGRDRSIARQAFTTDLPAKVVERRGKGSPQGFIYEIFNHFFDEIRQRLLDGFLVECGLLDRRALEASLWSDQILNDQDVLRLLQLTDTEAWVRHWRAI